MQLREACSGPGDLSSAELVEESELLIGSPDDWPDVSAAATYEQPKRFSPLLARFLAFSLGQRLSAMSNKAPSSPQAAEEAKCSSYERVNLSDVPDYQVSSAPRRSWDAAASYPAEVQLYATQAGVGKQSKLSLLDWITLCATVLSILLIITLIFCTFNELNNNLTRHKLEPLDGSRKSQAAQNNDGAKLNARSDLDWLVESQKCRIPVLDAWHDSIKGFVMRKKSLDCREILAKDGSFKPSLTFVRDNKICLTEFAQQLNISAADCCYRQITRGHDDRSLVYGDQCNEFSQLQDFQSPFELIKIECSTYNYTNYHSFIVSKPEEKAARGRQVANKLDLNKYYNVVIVGIDTISRLNGQRQLNRSLQVLRDQFGALEFKGYNKVGENTFPNLVPLLIGLRPEQLFETGCWAANYTQASESGDGYLDGCKYLWNYYRDLGYATYFSEDWPQASTFNYLKDGFRSQPTSFYGRPFTIARDHLLLPKVGMGCANCLLDRPLVEIDLENLRGFLTENKELPYFAFHWINCPQHDDLNGASQVDEILERFFSDIKHLTKDDRTFVVFLSDHGYRWNDFVSTRIGHYESSLPMLSVAAPKHFIENQPQLYENLKTLQNALLTPFDLFKTMIDIRGLGIKAKASLDASGKLGAITSSQPTSGKQTHPDESAPIQGSIEKVQVSKASERTNGLTYRQPFSSISLLERHDLNALNRSCAEAGIPDNYCVCHEFQQVSALADDVQGAAMYLVHVHFYKILHSHRDLCMPLDLDRVVQAELFDYESIQERRMKRSMSVLLTTTPPRQLVASGSGPPDNQKPQDQEPDGASSMAKREYNLTIQTLPGKALFREVVRYYGDNLSHCRASARELKDKLAFLDAEGKHQAALRMNKVCKFGVYSESISRLNLYKGQSDCVKSNIELKKTCYCR